MKRPLFTVFRAIGGAAVLFGIALACSSASLDDPPELLGVETQALTACATTSQCSGGQQCCGGFCRNLVSLGANDRLEYGCYAAQPAPNIGTPPAIHKVPDFSFAGYKMGGVAIPSPEFGVQIHPIGSEASDSANLQSWLDWCATELIRTTASSVRSSSSRQTTSSTPRSGSGAAMWSCAARGKATAGPT
jgi:hypothetical protein